MRRRGWLFAAVLLIAAAAALMFYGEKPAPPPPRVEVAFPRSFRGKEWERMEKRRTLPPPVAPSTTAAPAPEPAKEPARPRDPLLAALSVTHKQSAVVIEANALRYSPVGQLLIDCLTHNARGTNPIKEIKEHSGVDVLQDLDRVAIIDEGVILSGNFSKARWGDLLKDEAQPSNYGDKGTLYEPVTMGKDGKPRPQDMYMVSWGDQMLFMGSNKEDAQSMVDQLEGRGMPSKPILSEDQTYGEIYGVLSSKDMAALLPPDQAALAERLRSVADKVELHVDATKDVGIVADFRGQDSSQMQDLAKSLGGALSLARMKAQAEGDQNAADLLDLARIKPGSGLFKMEMALPLEMLEKQLAVCRNRNKAAQAAQPPSP